MILELSFFLNPQERYRPHKSSLAECSPWRALGNDRGNWSGRGSKLLSVAQRSKQMVFPLYYPLC